MSLTSGHVDNDGIRLRYLANGGEGRPLLLCPGLSDCADDYRDVLDALLPLHAVAMSFRGQRGSDAPPRGYDLEYLASDIEAVVRGLDLHEVVVFAHSRAVPYAIAYTAAHADRVATLVLGDSPAVHRAYPEAWVEGFAATTWRGEPVRDRIPTEVLRHIQRGARHIELWDTVAALSVPVVAILGGARDREVLDGTSERYRQVSAEVVVLDGSGHDLWEPALDRFVSVLRSAAGRAPG